MTNRPSESPQELRRRAEEVARGKETELPDEARQILHELRVHQIELEMQNEELRRLRDELEVSQQRYFSLYDLAPVGYLTLNRQGLIQEANLAAATTFGAVQKDLLGKPITKFMLREDLNVYQLNRGKVLSINESQNWEMRMVRVDGSRFWARLRATPADNGEYWITLNDITELKLYDKDLLDKNSELERFTYTVSHDLKSPLITIQNYAGMIRHNMEAGNHESIQDDLKRIEGAADKMNTLLNDLLEWSHIGRQMDTLAVIDMNLLVEEAMKQLAGPLAKQKIEIVINQDLPQILGNYNRITVVLQNLVENAIKYMGDQEAPRIEIGTRNDGSETVFFVRDNGKGIDPSHHETIFGLFNKLDAKSEGSGVGLALVKRVIEIHGGRVWVESTGTGKGSTFCFTESLTNK